MLVAPLLFLKNLSSLAPASILALAAVTWLVSIVVYVVFDMTLQNIITRNSLVIIHLYHEKMTRIRAHSNITKRRYLESLVASSVPMKSTGEKRDDFDDSCCSPTLCVQTTSQILTLQVLNILKNLTYDVQNQKVAAQHLSLIRT